MRAVMNRLANPFVALLLRSPLHGLLGGSVALITVTGRKSGRRYTTPVQFVRRGATLYVTSRPERRWWRNLRDEAPVALQLGGRRVNAVAAVLSSPERAAGAAALGGSSLEAVAQRPETVIVRIRLST